MEEREDYSKQVVIYDDEMMKFLAEDDEGALVDEYGVPIKKKGQEACPICNVLVWKDGISLSRHVFKNHINDLLASFGRTNHKLFPPPYSVLVGQSIYSKSAFGKSDTFIDKSQNSLKVGGIETHGHGEDGHYRNPLTGRLKLFHRKRPDPPMRFMYFCFLCEHVWTSKKTAEKHFTTESGKRTPCFGSKQHEKIQWFLDKQKGFVKDKTYMPTVANEIIELPEVAPIVVDNTNLVVSAEKDEVEALRKEIASQKKKLIKFTTAAVTWTREKEKLTVKLERAERYVAIKEQKVVEKEIKKVKTKKESCYNCKQEDLSMGMCKCSICSYRSHYSAPGFGCRMLYCELIECQKPLCRRCKEDNDEPAFCSPECKKTFNQNHQHD